MQQRIRSGDKTELGKASLEPRSELARETPLPVYAKYVLQQRYPLSRQRGKQRPTFASDPIIAAGFKVGAVGMIGVNSPCGAGARRIGIRE